MTTVLLRKGKMLLLLIDSAKLIIFSSSPTFFDVRAGLNFFDSLSISRRYRSLARPIALVTENNGRMATRGRQIDAERLINKIPILFSRLRYRDENTTNMASPAINE